jgi:hypothetical protein
MWKNKLKIIIVENAERKIAKMSGGHFDYQQFQLTQIADEIELLIQNNGKDEWYTFSERDLTEFRKGLVYMKIAYIYAQRIDWYVSGDDGEDSFHKRLKEELESLRKQIRSKKPVEKWLKSI